jgi:hypothetical protein
MKREKMLERSLVVRNVIIKEIKEKFNIDFGYSYNDLYKINGGEVRRLKGCFNYLDFRNMDDYNKFLNSYNDLFNKVKEFLKEYKLEEFEVKIEKLYDIYVREYKLMKNKGYIGNFEDYKKDKYNNERVLILSIRWKY